MKHSKHLFSSLFYVPKYEKVSDKTFSRIMLSSVFGILFCGICLAGLSWAWFTSSVTSTANNITAADFSVEIVFKQNESVVEPDRENESYKLNNGTYKVTVTASGTASTGYCNINLDGQAYHTVQLFPNAENGTQSVTFTVNAAASSKLAIIPQWGTCAVTATAENPRIGSVTDTDNHIINSIGTPLATQTAAEDPDETTGTDNTYTLTDTEQTYTVQQGDTLSDIANRYGTTVDVLSAYNNIQNVGAIQVGATVKIPPASYTIPATPTTQPTGTDNAENEPSLP